LHERLPGISETAKIFAGVDVTRAPIPVLPTCHYNMGGIPTNYHGEVLNPTEKNPNAIVPGLMAVGEAACVSVHGANRLGSNSLLDLAVFGRAAALHCGKTINKNEAIPELPKDAGENSLDRLDKKRHASGDTPTAALRLEMQNTMQRHCAVFRSKEMLDEGVKKINAVHQKCADIKTSDRSMIWNSDLMEALEFDNLIIQARATMVLAHNRQETRGAHAREDFPDRDDKKWMKHSIIHADLKKDALDISYRPVEMTPMSDDVKSVPPKARVY
jgi:succinate dehydrogenase / fumarate reductase flavoprotein subunit